MIPLHELVPTGNEFSYFMLMVSNFVLNGIREVCKSRTLSIMRLNIEMYAVAACTSYREKCRIRVSKHTAAAKLRFEARKAMELEHDVGTLVGKNVFRVGFSVTKLRQSPFSHESESLLTPSPHDAV